MSMRPAAGLRLGDCIRVGAAAAPASTLLNDLEAYWTLNETSGTRVDSVGSSDLSDNNTVGSDTGKNDKAASFVAGNSEYLSIATSPVNPAASDYSLAIWLNAPSSTGVLYLQAGHYISYTTDFGGVVLYKDQAGHQIFTTEGDITGDWVLVLVTFATSSGAGNLYVYGGGSAGTPGTGTLDADNASGGALWLGRDGSNVYTLKLDEFAYWSRVLTEDERAELYNSGDGFFYPFT